MSAVHITERARAVWQCTVCGTAVVYLVEHFPTALCNHRSLECLPIAVDAQPAALVRLGAALAFDGVREEARVPVEHMVHIHVYSAHECTEGRCMAWHCTVCVALVARSGTRGWPWSRNS